MICQTLSFHIGEYVREHRDVFSGVDSWAHLEGVHGEVVLPGGDDLPSSGGNSLTELTVPIEY